MTRIDGIQITVDGAYKDRVYTSQHVIDVLDAGPSGSARATTHVSYQTLAGITVYYSALTTSGSILTARTTTGVTEFSAHFYTYAQNTVGVQDFIAVWDDGDASDYIAMWIVVDQ